MKDKYIILYKMYNQYWKPYFFNHCYDYEYAKQLYDKCCETYPNGQWCLLKIEDLYIKDEEFIYMEENI